MLTVSASQSSVAMARPALPKKLVIIGDSVIYGYGDPEGGGWVERLRRQWMAPDSLGHVIYNLGVRGDGVEQVSRRLEQEFRLRGELRNRVPDLIVLSVGVNDSARVGRPNGRPFTDFGQFQDQMADLLDQAQRLCPVLFVGMTPVQSAAMPFAEVLYYCHADQLRYKEATRQACQVRGIPYLDIFQSWVLQGQEWWQARIGEDGLHPNTLGYRTLLSQVSSWDALAQAIEP